MFETPSVKTLLHLAATEAISTYHHLQAVEVDSDDGTGPPGASIGVQRLPQRPAISSNLHLSAAAAPFVPPPLDGLTEEVLESCLTSVFGYKGFRGQQLDVIRRVLAGQSTLAILPTGTRGHAASLYPVDGSKLRVLSTSSQSRFHWLPLLPDLIYYKSAPSDADLKTAWLDQPPALLLGGCLRGVVALNGSGKQFAGLQVAGLPATSIASQLPHKRCHPGESA